MFSVVIPAYNCEKTITRVLDSVISQSGADLIDEVIIINDGSRDHTDQVIRKYLSKQDQIPFRYYVQENHGVSFTRNRAVKMALGEWIALLDADDVWKPNKLERQNEIIQSVSGICFLGSFYPLRFLGRAYKPGLYKITAKQLCIRNMPTTPSVVFKREEGLKLGLFDESVRYGEDIRFYQKFLLKDSYYILAEDLVEISIGKHYFAQNGLSSHLKEMHKGRNFNTEELYRMGLISKKYMIFTKITNQLKYIRRVLQFKATRRIFALKTLQSGNMYEK